MLHKESSSGNELEVLSIENITILVIPSITWKNPGEKPGFGREDIKYINLFKLNGISQSYQLDESSSSLKVVGWYFHFYSKFFRTFCKQTVDSSQTPQNTEKTLGL